MDRLEELNKRLSDQLFKHDVSHDNDTADFIDDSYCKVLLAVDATFNELLTDKTNKIQRLKFDIVTEEMKPFNKGEYIRVEDLEELLNIKLK